MPQRDREQRLTRAEKLAGVQNENKVANPCATWREVPEWSVPKEITGGVNCSYLHDPRPLDQPDIPYEQYAAEMDRRLEENPEPDWEPAPDAGPPRPSVRPWEHSYRVSLAMRRYVYPPSQPKAAKPLVSVDAPMQDDLDIDENGF